MSETVVVKTVTKKAVTKKKRPPRERDPSQEETLTVHQKLLKIKQLEDEINSVSESKKKLISEKQTKAKVVDKVFDELGQNIFYAGPCVVSKVNAKNHRKDTLKDTWEAIKTVLGKEAFDEISLEVDRLKKKYESEAVVEETVSLIPTGDLRKPRTKKQKVQ
jgi:hypothetical protein